MFFHLQVSILRLRWTICVWDRFYALVYVETLFGLHWSSNTMKHTLSHGCAYFLPPQAVPMCATCGALGGVSSFFCLFGIQWRV
ncbi:hypothetical protein P153DRAFT_24632 [Dothidotthia symphoricarpi CBS 119687]|uniref:Uncharacterized protein n=1 Tax=Dothidotthia symphoricarpi CBS 119687 TaxID=1392245 RepID=A0A6A6AA82_9PLEO|nr:uncharacterized protein P153DRAFT_24632 [Dothidotthia symphoricarpi CBS 119687]KAF2128730.1 hypothetical protein P153DRAFT_24632 [Dothidotthia symphoricarpi CBS 119687]